VKWIAVLFLLASSALSHATELVIYEKPVRSRHLSGAVIDPAGSPIPRANVELVACGTGERQYRNPEILTSVVADANGKFLIRSRSYPKPYCLRFSALGFNQLWIRVHLSKLAGPLRPKLSIAT